MSAASVTGAGSSCALFPFQETLVSAAWMVWGEIESQVVLASVPGYQEKLFPGRESGDVNVSARTFHCRAKHFASVRAARLRYIGFPVSACPTNPSPANSHDLGSCCSISLPATLEASSPGCWFPAAFLPHIRSKVASRSLSPLLMVPYLLSGLRLAEQLGRREDEAKIRHGLGLSLWASGNLEEAQHQVRRALSRELK